MNAALEIFRNWNANIIDIHGKERVGCFMQRLYTECVYIKTSRKSVSDTWQVPFLNIEKDKRTTDASRDDAR